MMRVFALLAAVLLSACATQVSQKPPAPAAAAQEDAAASTADAPAVYSLDISVEGSDASSLRTLLQQNLDLARYRANEAALSRIELARLAAAAPAQAQSLLETEGYFNASASVERDVDDPTQLHLRVKPGPVTHVTALQLSFEDGLSAEDAKELRERLRAAWPLPEGSAFTQSLWSSGKNELLVRARTEGFPRAHWADTAARVDAPNNTAALTLKLAGGARARMGELRIEGLERQHAETVERLAGFDRGDPYTEQALVDFQERLVKTQLFDAARVQLLADTVEADGSSPVIVSLREASLQQATVAVGYHANTGQSISVEHLHRQPFGLAARARSKVQLGRDLKGAEFELSSHPQTDLRRNLASLQYERDTSGGQIANNFGLRLGRIYESTRDERLSYVELLSAHETVGGEVDNSRALSINRQWIRRRLDSQLLPTDGHQALLLVGAGMAQGGGARGAFGRVQLKLGVYRPLGLHWYGSARAELGQVIAHDEIGLPQKLLWRAGGDESVRGYAYNSLGPLRNGSVVGGRVLATGSIELARPITMSFPSLWGAVFVDAGNAASRWTDYRPDIGWGAGLRWRSPVGPLRVDLARGVEVKKWRLHFSVGIAL